mgnify:CR=1 FL=1
MINAFRSAIASIRKFLDPLLDYLIISAVIFLVIDVLWGVYTRYRLGEPSRWTEEIARFLLMWVALLGTAVAFREKEHLGFDYLINKLHPEARRLAALASHLVTLTFVAFVMVVGGFSLVFETLEVNQLTPALELRMGYVYVVLPLSGLFIVLYVVEQFLCELEDESRIPLSDEAHQDT